MIFKSALKCALKEWEKIRRFEGAPPFKESRVGFYHDHVHSNPSDSLVRNALDNTTASKDDRA